MALLMTLLLRQWFRVDACIVARTCADGEAPLVDAVAHTGATQTSVCSGLPVDVAPGCIKEFGGDMDLRKIDQCVKGKQGTELLLQNMVQTKTLVPPIQVLPWILVDQEVLNWPNDLMLSLSNAPVHYLTHLSII